MSIANPFQQNTLTAGGSSSSTLSSSSTGLSINGLGTGGAVGAVPGNTFLASASIQMFRTIPVPNRLANLFSLHCYQKKSKSPGIIYNFPISPTGYTRAINAVTKRNMIQGQQNGSQASVGQVSYTFDEYGYTPPSFLIEGTTGWKYHTLDGGQYSGYQSFQNLQDILKYYYDKNVSTTNNNLRYVFALYDYYNQLYWEVVPIGEQVFSMSENAPLNGYYRLYFEGVRSISTPIQTIELKSVLDQVLANVLVSAANTVAAVAAPVIGVGSDLFNLSSNF